MGTESAKAQSGGIRWKDGVVGMQKSSQGRMCPWKASRCVQKLGVGIGRGTMALLCRQC